MSVISTPADIEYPESDGKPMGETDLHRYWMNRLYDQLSRRYRGQRAYVGCDLLVYYTPGKLFDVCVPDVFVALGAAPGFRRTFKTWEEGLPPTVVFEVTSQSTRREDEVFKPLTYARIGVQEYFLFDPTADYLSPPLMGFRMTGDDHGPIVADVDGTLASSELGLRFWLQAGELMVADAATGDIVLTDAEAAEALAEEHQRRAAAALDQAETERIRAEAAEAELAKLKEQLANLQRPNDSTGN
jgi:Uma2 family endonuclease